MADSSDKSTTDDEPQRQRARVERLLAQSAQLSSGHLTIGGNKLEYGVSAGFVPIVANMSDSHKGEPDAALFLTSYSLQHGGVPARAAQRPILFAFNGGPGASSVWLHLGALGPKRVPINDDGSMPPPPYCVQDNHIPGSSTSTWCSSTRHTPGSPFAPAKRHARRCSAWMATWKRWPSASGFT